MPNRAWLAIGILFGVLVLYLGLRNTGGGDGRYVSACAAKPRTAPPGAPGYALLATQEFVACVRGEAKGKVSGDFAERARMIEIPPAPDCRYVGVWKSIRPASVYQVTLDADRRFEAHALQGGDGAIITGAWLSQGDRITWLYDAKVVWPPDVNPVRDATADTFSLVEVDGGITRFELLERIPSRQCP
jgi:hypothetical protein